MTQAAADRLKGCVTQRYNILVAGSTSSGKTTLANALLAEMAWVDERVILIEDTRELQSPAADTVALRTRPGIVTMADLVRSTLRLRPDRIIVGEVRGPEALDMLKRSEEHTSELPSLMRISYAVFCLKTKKQ